MGGVGEISPGSANPAGGGQCFVQAHMSWVRGVAQGVEHGNFHATQLVDHRRGHLFAIAEISQALLSPLAEKKAISHSFAMRQGMGGDLQISDFKRSIDHVLFRDKITPRPGATVKSIRKYAPQILHCLLAGVNGQRLATARITKAAAIIQSHNVVRVGMSENDCIEPADILAQTLDPKLRSGIHDQLGLICGQINRRAGAMVLRVGQKLRWIIGADNRHTLGSS